MTITVEGQAGLVAALARIAARLNDLRPLWDRLDGGPFPTIAATEGPLRAEMRAVWDRSFDLGLRHSPGTVEDRSEGLTRQPRAGRAGKAAGKTYYNSFSPGGRAKPDAPYLEWTGALRAAASTFTTREPLRATIDPVANYQGPLETDGGWNATGAAFLQDADVFKVAALEKMIEDEAERWFAAEFV